MSYIDPIKEAQAVASLRESIAALDADDALLMDTIEGETSLLEAMDKIMFRMTEDKALAAGIEQIIADLTSRKTRVETRLEHDRALIEQAMMTADLDKIERPAGTLSLTKRAAKLVITDEADIPGDFWKPGKPTLDKKALTEALKDGATVAGAVLSNSAPSLTIRVK